MSASSSCYLCLGVDNLYRHLHHIHLAYTRDISHATGDYCIILITDKILLPWGDAACCPDRQSSILSGTCRRATAWGYNGTGIYKIPQRCIVSSIQNHNDFSSEFHSVSSSPRSTCQICTIPCSFWQFRVQCQYYNGSIGEYICGRK